MPGPNTRNLTILLTDIKGFTDKTSHKSRAEIQILLDRHKEIVLPIILTRGGRLVKTMGDAFLATFESPTNAVLAGVEAQAALAAYNIGRPEDDRIEIRVAINQGEVNVVDNDIFGEPVNITARIEAVADAGDVFFTEAIYLAMNKKEVPSSEVGLLQLKGIPEKVRVYRVRAEHPVENMDHASDYLAERSHTEAAPSVPSSSPAQNPAAPPRTNWIPAAVAVLACVAAAFFYVKSRAPASAPSAPGAAASPAPAPAVSARPAAGSPAARVAARAFPSVFMAWERPNKKNADPLVLAAALARNDMIFSGPFTFRLKWNGASEGLAEDFTPESVAESLTQRRDLLARNPNLVELLEIRYRNYADDALPAEHPWWRRDAQGARIQAWKPGYSQLDTHSPAFQDHVAAQCRAAVRSGAVDGCYFNVWQDDEDDVALLKKVRAAVGEDALLMASSGKELPLSAPLLNGQNLNMNRDVSPRAWTNAARVMVWGQSHLREPRLVALAVEQDQPNPALLRMVTTLSLTHSDGFALFAQTMGAAEGWRAEWPAIWNKTLGRPVAPGQPRDDGSTSREFANGTAVYNPPDGKPAKLSFAEERTSAATGRKGKTFTLAAGDGDLYLK
ncbi:MAG: adenylate/guanylate cyclase domain-containing protein [Elusimicrobiota bacterium]